MELKHGEAFDHVVEAMKRAAAFFGTDRSPPGNLQDADISVYAIGDALLRSAGLDVDHARDAFWRPLFDAAWHLCLRGMLRPGPARKRYGVVTATPGDTFSLTTAGKNWALDPERREHLPEPTRLGETLVGFRGRFGEGYAQRAEEAVSCYAHSHYLAASALAGAAAESILLALASTKEGEAAALARYSKANGRASLVRSLVGGAPRPLASKIESYFDGLSYWRDETSHGRRTEVGDAEAALALHYLLRLAQLVDYEWPTLLALGATALKP